MNPDVYSCFTDKADQVKSIAHIKSATAELRRRVLDMATKLAERPRPDPRTARNDLHYAITMLAVRMHLAGLNMRNLGAVRTACESPYWRLLCLVSMVCRRLKALLEERLRDQAGGSCVQTFLAFANHSFGNAPTSAPYWDAVVLPSIVRYFGPMPDVPSAAFKEYFFASAHDDLLGESIVARCIKGALLCATPIVGSSFFRCQSSYASAQ